MPRHNASRCSLSSTTQYVVLAQCWNQSIFVHAFSGFKSLAFRHSHTRISPSTRLPTCILRCKTLPLSLEFSVLLSPHCQHSRIISQRSLDMCHKLLYLPSRHPTLLLLSLIRLLDGEHNFKPSSHHDSSRTRLSSPSAFCITSTLETFFAITSPRRRVLCSHPPRPLLWLLGPYCPVSHPHHFGRTAPRSTANRRYRRNLRCPRCSRALMGTSPCPCRRAH